MILCLQPYRPFMIATFLVIMEVFLYLRMDHITEHHQYEHDRCISFADQHFHPVTDLHQCDPFLFNKWKNAPEPPTVDAGFISLVLIDPVKVSLYEYQAVISNKGRSPPADV